MSDCRVPMQTYEPPMIKGLEKQWEHKGLQCAVIKQPGFYHRCGYVGVWQDSPLYRKKEAEIERMDEWRLYVHGGVTFAGRLPLEDDGKGLWWIGFDCNHGGDAADVPDECPEDVDRTWYEFQVMSAKVYGSHVWTLEEVVAETERLADQLAELPPLF